MGTYAYIIIVVFVVILLLASPFLIICFASWHFKREIAKADTASAIHYRKLAEAKREEEILSTKRATDTIYAVIIVVSIIVFIVLCIKEGFEWENLFILFAIAYDVYAYKHNYQRLIEKLRGHISHMFADELLSMQEPFALYLRGFKDDSYSNKYKERDFNELEFSLVVKEHLGIDMYAIGMTKELDSPKGAQRVYVDDETWKEKVEMLIEKSSRIYVLVNNRESCLWEMRQVAPYLAKTAFIVNDRSNYQQIRESLAPYISFPEAGGLKAKRFFFNQRMVPIPFSNRQKDYIRIALNNEEHSKYEAEIAVQEKELAIAQSQKNAHFEKVIYFAAIIVVILLLLFMFSR